MTATFDQFTALVRGGESETLEFKKSTANLPQAGEPLCGTLIAVDGVLLFEL